jgi:hypothetical protein
MKTLLMITTFISSIAFAGGTGGGGVLRANASMNPEIVYAISENDYSVKFNYGTPNDNSWNIEQIEVPIEAVAEQPDLMFALRKSKVEKNWILIK